MRSPVLVDGAGGSKSRALAAPLRVQGQTRRAICGCAAAVARSWPGPTWCCAAASASPPRWSGV